MKPYRSDEEAPVAAVSVVAQPAALQEHNPVVRGAVSTYEETSLCEIVAQSHGVRGRHPHHLVSLLHRLSIN